MPTYEYACKSCGNQWEEIQKISEAALTECPKCKQQTAQRQISGGNFILKGGGWYADLYSSTKPSAKSETKGESTTSTPKAETKSESSGSSAPAAAPAAPAAPAPSGGSSGAAKKD